MSSSDAGDHHGGPTDPLHVTHSQTAPAAPSDNQAAPGDSPAERGAADPWTVARYMASVNPVMKATGMRILDTRAGYARMSMFISEQYGNTYGVCHGGVVFSLADMCFGLAGNSHNVRCVTASADIDYISPGNVGADLYAEATEVHLGKRTALYDVRVTNADGSVAALARFKGRRLGGPVVPPDGAERPEQLTTPKTPPPRDH
ncbi:MAG: hotdog fold thioesterase [Pseudomonadota bacterium]